MDGFTVAGLVLDIAGATLLARGLAFVPVQKAVVPARFRAEGDWRAEARDDVVRAADQAETQAGLWLLVSGFVLQGVTALGADSPPCVDIGAPAGALLVVGLVWWRLRPWLVARRRRDVFFKRVAYYRSDDPQSAGMSVRQLLTDYSMALHTEGVPGGFSAEKGESALDHVKRALRLTPDDLEDLRADAQD